MLQLLIADDHEWTREGLRKTVNWSEFGIEVCAVCENGTQAFVTLQQKHVDIVLTDIRMPGMDGIALAEVVHHDYPNIALVLMSAYQEFDYAYKAVNLGVCAYLLKPAAPEDIRKVFRSVVRRLTPQTEDATNMAEKASQEENAGEVIGKNNMRGQQKQIVQEARNYIERHLSVKSLSLRQVADDLHTNYFYLSKCFKEDENCGFNEYLSDMRLNMAKSLLSSTNFHIYEICGQIGLEQKNFYLLFHKKFGMSPNEFRHNHSKPENSKT